jgi:hypothetical protein
MSDRIAAEAERPENAPESVLSSQGCSDAGLGAKINLQRCSAQLQRHPESDGKAILARKPGNGVEVANG